MEDEVVRKYFRDKEGQLKPTRKGISLSLFQYEQICSLIENSKEDIELWFKGEESKIHKKKELQAEVAEKYALL